MGRTLDDALAVIQRAPLADLGLLQAALDTRRTELSHATANTLSEGDAVRLQEAEPPFLNGLTGSVVTINTDGVAGPVATILLDARSTGALRFSGRSEYRVPGGDERFEVTDIPLECVVPARAELEEAANEKNDLLMGPADRPGD